MMDGLCLALQVQFSITLCFTRVSEVRVQTAAGYKRGGGALALYTERPARWPRFELAPPE